MVVVAALGDIARAKGMTQIARETGLGRESLYKVLSTRGNPEFATILKVVRALGLQLHAEGAGCVCFRRARVGEGLLPSLSPYDEEREAQGKARR